MPIKYKINVLNELKAAGYNTNRLRKERLLSEGTIQNISDGRIIKAANLAKVCKLLNCQPGDIMEYVEDKE